ncbi:hypothetical protein [Streptomyces sp. NPDC051776]|uniref:hypothetical protein n=1 Tax=Streptomyces sp. NPDC051776 TaxID=3155414 RepID=UPI0034430F94
MALPEPDQWLMLDLARDKSDAWALELARRHLGEGAADTLRHALAGYLTQAAETALSNGAMSAAVLAPVGGPPVAFLQVREMRIPVESWQVEALRAEAELIEGPFFREPQTSSVDLPLGPAMRVHRVEPIDPDSDSTGVLEGVAHYVLPSQCPGVAIELVMIWHTPGLGGVLEEMADRIAASALLT